MHGGGSGDGNRDDDDDQRDPQWLTWKRCTDNNLHASYGYGSIICPSISSSRENEMRGLLAKNKVFTGNADAKAN